MDGKSCNGPRRAPEIELALLGVPEKGLALGRTLARAKQGVGTQPYVAIFSSHNLFITSSLENAKFCK